MRNWSISEKNKRKIQSLKIVTYRRVEWDRIVLSLYCPRGKRFGGSTHCECGIASNEQLEEVLDCIDDCDDPCCEYCFMIGAPCGNTIEELAEILLEEGMIPTLYEDDQGYWWGFHTEEQANEWIENNPGYKKYCGPF